MARAERQGLVLKNYAGFYYVEDEEGSVRECVLRGKLRTRVLTGDRVRISLREANRGVVEEVLPRHSELQRPPVANIDLVLVVFAADRPSPDLVLLDRLLVLVQHRGLQPVVVLNKCDLQQSLKAEFVRSYYPTVGYRVVAASAVRGDGLNELAEAVRGRVAVMAGPSGVGKSSLLNAMIPELRLATGDVSRKLGRGRHTTRHVELCRVPGGGWIADTPGFSVLDLPPMRPAELAALFPEFEAPAARCRFRNCLHAREEDCAVKAEVEAGRIAPGRYQHYRAFLAEVIENARCFR
ncbi:MAG: ribosome small subunit-dependent GTPase A [Syntrophomonadaceae bacterium]|jgi:ribosome biogenesis GTPase|nr:ribosome small subunit-dependent GTPase A [Syntrophomonadaceae bacterium]MDH7497543.1 ribosome small subunit-dependent GTPase A [Syntrophomonadaceae bacterium]